MAIPSQETSNTIKYPGTGKKIVIAMLVYLSYVAIVLVANILQDIASSPYNETLDSIAGILLGVIAIPIFSIFLPLFFAKRWKLDYSFWPKNKSIFVVIVILVLYIVLVNYGSIRDLMSGGIPAGDFAIHYFSSMLFHVTYYPLFVVLIFPVLRKATGLIGALMLTSLMFALYHLVQYYNFPGGLEPMMQVYLFLAFIVQILFYIWSESIILVALTHSINGAIGLIGGGTLFNQIDFVFFLSIVIIAGLFAYMVFYEIEHRKDLLIYDKDWWLHIKLSKGKT